MKKLVPAYILCFIISFMAFIYEPLIMYSTNVNDFWFDIGIMIKPMLLIFLLSFALLSLIFTITYKINYKLSNKLYIYHGLLLITFILFFASYIQGNYLIGNLPPLDGTKIDFSNYTVDNIITIIIWIILIVGFIILIKKFKFEKVLNVSSKVSLAVFAMLLVSLISTLLTSNAFISKRITAVTSDNINDASSDKNLFVFVVDAVDSRKFDEELTDSKYKDLFDDFTYYKDTMSAYPYTRDSIPFMLSGIWNENEKDFLEYYNHVMDNSSLIKDLKEKKYDINIYEHELNWSTDKVEDVKNIKLLKMKVDLKNFAKQEIKYFLFKYLPYNLKKISKIETLKFKKIQIDKNKELDLYGWDNFKNYKVIKDNKITKIDNKLFSFVHIEGGHVPFDSDEELKEIKNGTYEQKLKATMKVIKAYLDRLKKYDVYDNSAIIILADHGFNYEDIKSTYNRQNPILYIKGIDEHHKMKRSDKAIMYEDLISAYKDLLDGKKSTELFKDISSERKRRYIWYKYSKENHMVEYEQTGKAWDMDKLKETGREFNR